MVAEAVDVFGALDGLVCNAGRSLMATLPDTSDEQVREEFELKIFGAWNVVRAARPHLAASDAASVVTVNAILAKQPEPRLAATSAARAALLNLTRSLSAELGPDGIRVNSVCLGLIDTGQWRRRYEAAGTPQSYEEWSAEIAADRGIALGRFGRAEEVAFPVVTLLSPLSGYCTGASIDVGGGVSRYV
jgi:NAD(P)-dependent dehydrogenase (short-subunit alcohol dehydrogenase family)